ncbi:MAG: MarR family transcriptional regulator [Candidatus Obscuribacterales bacterium]|nr:MarR family transcriptional regulator [Candidatus Obscuribacterales bacterium]
MPESLDTSALSTKLWLSLWKASRSIEAHAHRSIASLDMSGTDFGILEALLHKGPLPVNTIGKKILLTSGSITTAVDRLEERGLVERIDDASDRRVRLVRLTASGTKLIKAAFMQHQKHLEKAMSHLNKEEQRNLLSLLKKLGQGADEVSL